MPQKSKNEIEKALGIENLPEKEREEILQMVNKRLEEVLIAVLISNISEEDALKIQEALKSGIELEETVARISVNVPGLARKIENGIEEELIRLRAVLKQG